MLLAEEAVLLCRSPCFHLQSPSSLNIVAEFGFSLNSIPYLSVSLFLPFFNQKKKICYTNLNVCVYVCVFSINRETHGGGYIIHPTEVRLRESELFLFSHYFSCCHFAK